MPDQNNRSSGFNLGLILGLLAGFVIAVLLYKRNPKVFNELADKLNDLIKDTVYGSVKTPRPKTEIIAKVKLAPTRPRRPKTFLIK